MSDVIEEILRPDVSLGKLSRGKKTSVEKEQRDPLRFGSQSINLPFIIKGHYILLTE